MAVKIELQYSGGLHCEAIHTPSQVHVSTDAPTDNGGKGSSFSPTDLLASSLGACMLTVMGLVAEKEKLKLAGTRATVVKEMVATPRRRVGTLRVNITFPKGFAASPEQRRRLEEAALFCPVQQSLHPEISMPVEFIYA